MIEAIAKIRARAKQDPKTIVLPEGHDERVRRAAEEIQKEGLARVILLEEGRLDERRLEQYARQYYEMRRHKGLTEEEARAAASRPVLYGAFMVREGLADGLVAGAATTTADVAKAAMHGIGLDERLKTITSCFLMLIPNCRWGENGVFIFADCGIIPEPSPRQLAVIAVTTADVARRVLGMTPRVAMLSYSTHGSAGGQLIERIREATALAREMAPGIVVDGELQVDTAIVPEVARRKNPDGIIQGNANILIFPSLESGNISYKLVERLTGGRAIGPVLLGANRPCSDLSRGCGWEDVVDATAVVVVMAQEIRREIS